jgi:hypothetical protein
LNGGHVGCQFHGEKRKKKEMAFANQQNLEFNDKGGEDAPTECSAELLVIQRFDL